MDTDKNGEYLAKFTLPDMLAFVIQGFHMILAARRFVWIPYVWLQRGHDLPDLRSRRRRRGCPGAHPGHAHAFGHDGRRDLTPEVVNMLVQSVSSLCKQEDPDMFLDNLGAIYGEWLLNFAAQDGDGHDAETPHEDAVKAVMSTGESPAKSDK